MKRFPLPLRWTVPAVLLVLGGLTSCWVLAQQLQGAYARLSVEAVERAKQVGRQTSTLLDYLIQEENHPEHFVIGMQLLMEQLAADRRLVAGVVLDRRNWVRVTAHPHLLNQPIERLALDLDPTILEAVRSSGRSRTFLNSTTRHIYAIYPLRFNQRTQTLGSAAPTLLVLVYDLNTERRRLLIDGIKSAPQNSWVLLIFCFATWRVFDRLVARRAQRLVQACDCWEHGQMSVRANLGGSDEFSQIGAALDRMVARVSESTAALHDREQRLHDRTHKLETALQELQQTQAQLVQTEKLSSLGQMVAGIAHEVNNPIGFIHGNLHHTAAYASTLLALVELYQQHYPTPPEEIQAALEAADLPFMREDLPKLLSSMQVGTDRIRDLVLSLRNFSRLDESGIKPVNLHEGLESTLTILQTRLRGRGDRPEIEVHQHYGPLPLVECDPGQINQVLAHLISNAIDAIDSIADHYSALNPPQLTIETAHLEDGCVCIRIADNGPGMEASVRSRMFDPFFTTKPIGKGTGLGLAIGYDIICKNHGGKLLCQSQPGWGTTMTIELPIKPLPALRQLPASPQRQWQEAR